MTEETLPPDAVEALTLIRELKVLDAHGLTMLEQIFAYRVSDNLVSTLIDGREDLLAVSLYKAIQNAAQCLGYILRLLSDLVVVCPSVAKQLARRDAVRHFGDDPCTRFLMIITTHTNDQGLTRPALLLSATILRFSEEGTRPQCILQFLNCIAKALNVADLSMSDDLEYVVHALSIFVKRKDYRGMFYEARLVPLLPRVLTFICSAEASTLVQLTYETLLVCWILSFDYRCMAELFKAKLFAVVHKTLQRAKKEKVIRMSILIFKNFIAAQKKFQRSLKELEWYEPHIDHIGTFNNSKGPNFYADMIGIGVLKTAWQLQRKKFGDEDITQDLEEMTRELEMDLDALTSFSEYKGELQSGVLEWSPVHSSVKFWKENFRQFESNHYEALRELVGLLDAPSELTVAVACHDIGELVRHHPSGRLMLQVPSVSGSKEKVMRLMSHTNAEVARHALLAVQKIMVQRFDFLASS